jgi:hypothetical protein
LKTVSGGRGDTILWENFTRGPGIAEAGTVENLLDEWKMTRERVEWLLNAAAADRS